MKMVLKSALCAAFALIGNAAFAVDHEIRMERYGYFPKTIYVQAGDTITFVNKTPNWARIYSSDSNDNLEGYDWNAPCLQSPKRYDGDADGWSIGWFSVNQTKTVTVTSCMETTIHPPKVYQYSYDDSKYRATIIFGNAPTGS